MIAAAKYLAQRKLVPDFVVVPDIVQDAEKTSLLFDNWVEIIKKSFPNSNIAFAAQDGHTVNDVPHGADMVFLGGSTRWKLQNIAKFCSRFNTHVARVLRQIFYPHSKENIFSIFFGNIKIIGDIVVFLVDVHSLYIGWEYWDFSSLSVRILLR